MFSLQTLLAQDPMASLEFCAIILCIAYMARLALNSACELHPGQGFIPPPAAWYEQTKQNTEIALPSWFNVGATISTGRKFQRSQRLGR